MGHYNISGAGGAIAALEHIVGSPFVSGIFVVIKLEFIEENTSSGATRHRSMGLPARSR